MMGHGPNRIRHRGRTMRIPTGAKRRLPGEPGVHLPAPRAPQLTFVIDSELHEQIVRLLPIVNGVASAHLRTARKFNERHPETVHGSALNIVRIRNRPPPRLRRTISMPQLTLPPCRVPGRRFCGDRAVRRALGQIPRRSRVRPNHATDGARRTSGHRWQPPRADVFRVGVRRRALTATCSCTPDAGVGVGCARPSLGYARTVPSTIRTNTPLTSW